MAGAFSTTCTEQALILLPCSSCSYSCGSSCCADAIRISRSYESSGWSPYQQHKQQQQLKALCSQNAPPALIDTVALP
eukprot:5192-Heterococcus_DN1.PRE.2